MSNPLKPCPFCGGEAEVQDGASADGEPMFEVHCLGCGTEHPWQLLKADAVDAWNRRSEADRHGRLDRVRDMLTTASGLNIAVYPSEILRLLSADAGRAALEVDNGC